MAKMAGLRSYAPAKSTREEYNGGTDAPRPAADGWHGTCRSHVGRPVDRRRRTHREEAEDRSLQFLYRQQVAHRDGERLQGCPCDGALYVAGRWYLVQLRQ